ncbi:LacI family DNA-binding transcriptional regulator [Enterococcus casseliflavus]|uniref:LacI family DNA-binding transcriptional regulator n=1 Tax=Enterococcus casseliflavus TaxID=37734 RepID=UPI00115E4D3C|nr:LacI family DNA-binding transcriptional regulator [Enterococcus casseliflavus]
MANIRDIARLTGYSVSTVSRVINNNPYVSEEKRRKILAVMEEVNYIPNYTARALSVGKTKNIGVILPFVNHPYFDRLLSGITTAAFARGYKVTLLATNYDPQVEEAYLQEFAAKSFDALIITSRANPIETLLPYRSYGRIVFCENISYLTDGCTYIDREESIKEVFTYFKEQGIQKIGVTLGRSRKLSSNSKITVRLAHDYFSTFSEDLIFWDCLTEEDGKEAAAYFADKGVEAIFTNGDHVAAGIQSQAPGEWLVIGRDNLYISELLQLSTIDHHLQGCGETAVQLAVMEKSGNYHMPYEFIKR